VLDTHLTDLTTTYSLSSDIGIDMPTFHATVEHQLIRVSDLSAFARSSVEAEDSNSARDAIWHALTKTANEARSEITKDKYVYIPVAPTVPIAGISPLQEIVIGNVRNYCAWVPPNIAHADRLRATCEFAITLRAKMPNFVCEQDIERYRGFSHAPTDMVSASVRYEDGNESYSNVTVNGRSVSDGEENPGLSSTGEFVGDLRAIFDASNRARFEYAGEGELGGHAVWKFDYRIDQQKDPLWLFHAPDQIIAPPYSGELWIDQKDGSVLLFRSIAKEMPLTFPMKNVELQINYEKITFSDGTDFVLPVESMLSTLYTGNESSRNVAQFRNCHKFGSHARILLNPETASSGTDTHSGSLPRTSALAQKELQTEMDEQEGIWTAFGERALRQNEIEREAEQKHELDAVGDSTLQRVGTLRMEQKKILESTPSISRAGASLPDIEPQAILRARVNLVLVTVVLRDAKGQAVKNLGRENFRVFDNGKPQVLTYFSVEGTASGPPLEEKKFSSNVPRKGQVQDNTNSSVRAKRYTGYLFDDVHLNSQELAAASEAVKPRFSSLSEGESAALFTTSGSVIVDFTNDREKLMAALRLLKPHSILPESDCPPISHYVADLMVNKQDADANGVAVSEVMDCALRGFGFSSPEAQRLASHKALEVVNVGNGESENALSVLRNVIRRTEILQGQRSIVLISPGFLALTPDTNETVMAIIDHAVRAGVVINTLDAHGLYAPGFSSGSNDVGGAKFQLEVADVEARGEVMSEFASGTGGIFFHNNNDLREGFRRTTDLPEAVYILGFSPQKLDGRLHKLKVKLTGAPPFDIQARQAYYAVKAADRSTR
jgi:VWFA-related protein